MSRRFRSIAALAGLSLAVAGGARGDEVWVLVAGRYVGEPTNPNYQEPLLERFDAATGSPLGSLVRDDMDRAVAVGPDGNLYVSRIGVDSTSSIDVVDPDTGATLDGFGFWNGSITDLAFGPSGTLFVLVAARYVGDPGNPLYQDPLLAELNPVTGVQLDQWVRSDDRDRFIAVAANGDVYAGTSTLNDQSTIRIYAATDRSVVADTFGSWKSTPSSLALDPDGDLWVQIPGRFVGEPANPNYQPNQLDEWNPSGRSLRNSYPRADDRDRMIAVDPDVGTIFASTSLLNDQATLRAYLAANPAAVDDTLGSWKAGARDVAAPRAAPEPASAGLGAAALLGLAILRRRAS